MLPYVDPLNEKSNNNDFFSKTTLIVLTTVAIWQNADSIIVVLLLQAWSWDQSGVNACSSHHFPLPIRAIFLFSEGFHDLEMTFFFCLFST